MGRSGRALAIASLVLISAIVLLWGRSFFVYYSLTRGMITPRPLENWAVDLAKAEGNHADFMWHSEGCGIELWRGHLTLMHGMQNELPVVRDEGFEKKYVNKANWNYAAHRAIEPGYFPGGQPEFEGVFGWLGFGSNEQVASVPGQGAYRWYTFPVWPFALAGAWFPCRWLLRRLRARRRRAGGLCVFCGYDLRASERCPECGAVKALVG